MLASSGATAETGDPEAANVAQTGFSDQIGSVLGDWSAMLASSGAAAETSDPEAANVGQAWDARDRAKRSRPD